MSCKNVYDIATLEKADVQGLFKNVQMQGAQKPNREAYNDIR